MSESIYTIEKSVDNFLDNIALGPSITCGYDFAKKEPETVRAMFIDLYDESKEFRYSTRLNNELNALYQLRTDFIKRLNLENEAVVQLCKRIEQREVQKDIYRTNIADIKKAIHDKLNGRIEFLNKIKEKKQDNE